MNEKTNDPGERRPGQDTTPPDAAEPVLPADGAGGREQGDDRPAEGDAEHDPLLASARADEHDAVPADEPVAAPVHEPLAPTAAAPARRGAAVALALLALLAALVSMAAAGYLWWTGRASGAAAVENAAAIERLSGTLDSVQGSLRQTEQRIAELQGAQAGQGDDLAALDRRLEDFRENVADRYDSLPGRLSSLESSMASLQGISAGVRDAWLLSEAEHYLEIANAQLQLAGNPERALLALRFADQRLRQLEDPGLSEVRRALVTELRAVEAMEQPDIEGLSMTLASLAGSVESLPLASDAVQRDSGSEQPAADASGWDRAMASVKAAFSDIVTVRRTDEEVTPLMAPDAAYFLETNLALKLQTARLALLRGEQAIFEQSLEDAVAWLRAYYATDTRAVQSALETLSGLRGADWTVTPPDISNSLRLLRDFRQRNAAGEPVAPADELAQ